MGRGVTIGYNEKTGNWFAEIRVVVGLGGGVSFDAIDKGPEGRVLRDGPYDKDNPQIKVGESGVSLGTYVGVGASAGTLGYSVGGKAGKHFDGTNCSYSEGPKGEPGFNPVGAIGSGTGLSVGGAMGVSISVW